MREGYPFSRICCGVADLKGVFINAFRKRREKLILFFL